MKHAKSVSIATPLAPNWEEIRALARQPIRKPTAVEQAAWKSLGGSWAAAEADEVEQAILEGCERVEA